MKRTVFLLASALAATRLTAQQAAPTTHRAVMRDGVALATEVWLPPATSGGVPAILMRLPYGRLCCRAAEIAAYFNKSGYALVTQDVRGLAESGGTFEAWFQEVDDGYDAVEWVAAQPWSNHRVGMLGGSYLGTAQWMAAKAHPPALKAIAPIASGTDPFRAVPYYGGAFSLNSTLGFLAVMARRPGDPWPVFNADSAMRRRPVASADGLIGKTLPLFQEFLGHPTFDAYWKRMAFSDADFARTDLPVLYVTGWYDGELASLLGMWRGMKKLSPARDRQFMIMGPWSHENTFFGKAEDFGDLHFPPNANVDIWKAHLEFFDRFLKEKPTAPPTPPVRVYVTGADEWREYQDFPSASSRQTSLYLHPSRLDSIAPEREPSDSYVFDPAADDVYREPSLAPHVRNTTNRRDMLTYRTPVLDRALEVIGSVTLELFASSDGYDTDWVVNLFDESPDGGARVLAVRPGVLRARFRGGFEHEELLIPNEPTHFTIEVASIAHRFLPGHRVRLEIASSGGTRYDLNPNTGGVTATDTKLRPARNTIFHDSVHPSRLVLPVLPTP